MITGCQGGAHEPDELTTQFMTIVIPDRTQKKTNLVGSSGQSIAQHIQIDLGICKVCKVVYRLERNEDEDSNNDV